jgi:hypothetical protein
MLAGKGIAGTNTMLAQLLSMPREKLALTR